jgi:hypothetical protein
VEQFRIATGDYPDEYLNVSPLHPWNQPVYQAFNLLSGSRQWTMGGAAAIPFSEIKAYLDWTGITGDDAADWLYLLRELDEAYLEEVNRKKE